ncbi:hemolysin expression modulating protein [Escherichia coli]|uniref:Hemolysin expression modulating protein n=4 Tax=Escherichia coli TaxID=562 RepID=A0A1X9TR98_ECOLX|nr:hemolysin expression modulating protein [Escherichia coli]AQW76162.1 hemolysin expression modulating protein [Escherichia coli M8]AXF92163.1 hemolysin expression modulating protein [Escherichia coli APEC O2-211]AXY49123.1 hemolysin expression modulating protein [Escherichia coli Nissle 1917]EBW9262192.1 hemolysin expression modulating protein [Salmonella enterica subsp. enterica serovar Enteritidis]EFA5375237.1 hemolysin expression modulating protein [Escherichia coli O53]EFA5394585.1 hemo
MRKATLIVISGYGVMPSVLKTSFTGETGKWKGFRDNVRPL